MFLFAPDFLYKLFKFSFDPAISENNVLNTLAICTFLMIFVFLLIFHIVGIFKPRLAKKAQWKLLLYLTILLALLLPFIICPITIGIFLLPDVLRMVVLNFISIPIFFILSYIIKFFFPNTDNIPSRIFSKAWFKDISKKIFK